MVFVCIIVGLAGIIVGGLGGLLMAFALTGAVVDASLKQAFTTNMGSIVTTLDAAPGSSFNTEWLKVKGSDKITCKPIA